jgi:hypothetical protein
VYTSILSNADSKTVDFFIGLYDKCEIPEEKEKIALLLGKVNNSEMIQKVLEFSISVNLKFQLNKN